MTDDSKWEQHARWWQEGFTDGADPEYEEQIIPLVDRHLSSARRVLDVGCGEGQLARRIASHGASVIGLDPTPSQTHEAHVRAGGPQYAQAGAEALPLRSNSFDAVLMCLVLEHLDPFEPAIDEIARVLEPGGRFVLMLNHPLLQTPGSGWIDDQILEEQYWRVGPYLEDDARLEEVAPGIELPFVHRPLSRYVQAMSAVGLLIDHMEEPAPPPGFLDVAWEYRAAASIPRLMLLGARLIED
jgi:SAM-dependent methyltransferase